jgi:hypothetical protein
VNYGTLLVCGRVSFHRSLSVRVLEQVLVSGHMGS